MTITADDLVRREVYYCVSSLVHTLARVGDCSDRDAQDLMEQAMELAAPIENYEEAAREAGWAIEIGRLTGTVTFIHPDHGRVIETDGWRGICEGWDIEPYDREIFEFWIVSDWLADKLEAKGEKVDKDFAGMTIWARTTTGQAIAIDSVIEAIVEELNNA